jgi:predicted nucleic-acid-binding Zn-ribbon protein
MLYEYYCEQCGYTEELILPVDQRNKFVGMPCAHCGTPLSRDSSSHGGFKLGTDGKVGWSNDGYATTYGDAENFKAGRRIYK